MKVGKISTLFIQIVICSSAFRNHLILDTVKEFQSKCLLLIKDFEMTTEDFKILKNIHVQVKFTKMDEDHALRNTEIYHDTLLSYSDHLLGS